MGRAISTQPDPEIVRTSFRGIRPALYDFFTAGASREFRAAAIERLSLQPGDTVIDLGCGTGLSLRLLMKAVGPEGRVVGVDASPNMLARARSRVGAAGSGNVELVEAFAQDFQPQAPVDGVLACNVNQLICSPEVVQRAVAWLKPGGRFVAAGSRRGAGLGGVLRALLLRGHGAPHAARTLGRALDPAGATLAGTGANAGTPGGRAVPGRRRLRGARGQAASNL